MQLVDRIEKRRFVGREFLLWLWLESELFEQTLETKEHGSFGLWLEKRLVLSAGKESTRVTAPFPGRGREAKEALLRGQLPESAGIRIAFDHGETSFTLRAEALGVSSLKLLTVLDKEEPPSALIEELQGKKGPKRRAPKQADEDHEVFYERMRLTQEFEKLLETLYRQFLSLRLSETWERDVLPALRSWSRGDAVDAEAYRAARTGKKKR